jgi:hypothetical protein
MAFDGTYYKVYSFKKVYIQRNSTGTIVETEFPWPNALKPSSEQQTYTWSGGGAQKKVTVLIAQNWTLDLDVIPLSAHATIFGKAEVTDAGAADSLFDVSTLVGFGGGNDASGVSRGLRATANSYEGAMETAVEIALWAPVCTITLSQAMGLNTDGTADKTQYSFSATKTTVDITGATITGAASDGDFFFIGEST